MVSTEWSSCQSQRGSHAFWVAATLAGARRCWPAPQCINSPQVPIRSDAVSSTNGDCGGSVCKLGALDARVTLHTLTPNLIIRILAEWSRAEDRRLCIWIALGKHEFFTSMSQIRSYSTGTKAFTSKKRGLCRMPRFLHAAEAQCSTGLRPRPGCPGHISNVNRIAQICEPPNMLLGTYSPQHWRQAAGCVINIDLGGIGDASYCLVTCEGQFDSKIAVLSNRNSSTHQVRDLQRVKHALAKRCHRTAPASMKMDAEVLAILS